jgi:Mitochondrial biogenesis AIM24
MWTSVSSSGISFAQHGRRRVVRSVASALSLPAGVPCNVAVNRVSGARLLSSSSCQTCYESSRLSSREIDITGTGTATNSRRSQSTAALTPTPTTSDADAAGALSLPEPDANLIDFQIAAKIVGDESHVAMVELRPGETLRAESGAMIFMTEGIVSK